MMPSMKGMDTPVLSAMPTATGVRATMVPTDVPMENDMKHAAMKMPARIRLPGMTSREMLTAASMAPMALADWAKMPAMTNIHIICMMFLLAAPFE